MGGGSTREVVQSQSSSPAPVWFPGQQEYIPKFIKPFQDIFAGDFSGGTAGMLSAAARNAGAKETSESRKRISGTPGLSSPARTAMYRGAEEAGVTAAAGVPMDVWNKALSVLQGFALQQPVTGQISTGSAGGGGGWQASLCCFIFLSAGDGKLESYTRKFRDEHFKLGCLAERGYKWMASWLVPQMEKRSWVKQLVRWGMVEPLNLVARWTYNVEGGRKGLKYVPLAYGWIVLWSVLGMFAEARPQSTPRPPHTYYPSMSRSFWNRVREVI